MDLAVYASRMRLIVLASALAVMLQHVCICAMLLPEIEAVPRPPNLKKPMKTYDHAVRPSAHLGAERSVCGVTNVLGLLSLILSVAFCGLASGAGIPDMVGRWTWQRFTIEVRECAGNKICAKVVAGPKNVGMEIFASELTNKDGAWFGDVVNPETGATYRTRMQLTGSGTWRLDGCSASGVCLSGEFVRAH